MLAKYLPSPYGGRGDIVPPPGKWRRTKNNKEWKAGEDQGEQASKSDVCEGKPSRITYPSSTPCGCRPSYIYNSSPHIVTEYQTSTINRCLTTSPSPHTPRPPFYVDRRVSPQGAECYERNALTAALPGEAFLGAVLVSRPSRRLTR